MTEKTIEQHRQEFEDWFIGTTAWGYQYLDKKVNGKYLHQVAEISWAGWKKIKGIKE